MVGGSAGQSGELELGIPPGAVGVVLAKSGHLDVEVPGLFLPDAPDLPLQLGPVVKKLLDNEGGSEDQQRADEDGDQDETEPVVTDVSLQAEHGAVQRCQEVIEDWGGRKND